MTVLVDLRPSSSAPRTWKFPTFTRTRLDTGLDLVLCDLPGRPFTAARLIVDAGGTAEADGQAGVATLAARALTEGTDALDAYALAIALEGMGAEARGEVSWDALHVRLDVPASRIEPALALLADIVRRPGFRAADVERLQAERLDQIAQEKVDPATLATRAITRSVFVPEAPYARPLQGDEESIGSLGRDAVESFYRSRIESGAATLIVAGDLSAADLPAIASSAFGQFSGAAFGSGAAPVVDEQGGGRRIVLVDRPGSVQSTLAIGHAGPSRRIDDYIAVSTMAMVLGGVFGSRLNMKLREEKGYTYGAGASFEFRRNGGLFSARSSVRTEDTGPAVADAVGEIVRTHEGGIPESELASVREYRVGIYPIAYERPAAVAMGLADMVTHDLPEDQFDRMRAELAEVTAEDVTAAAATRLRPDDMAIVVVGDAERIKADLEATNLGPITTG